MQVTVDPISLLLEPSVSLLKIRGATIVCDELVALVIEIVSGLLNQRRFKFLLIDSLGPITHFDEHLN